jgi:two-component system KDP operon response regulator KdpE
MPDIILLDMVMPKFDGLQVCGLLWEWSQTPIIIVSTAQNVEDKIICLEAGADDYVCKPFAAAELIARVESVLRWSGGAINSVPSVLKFDGIAIDFSSKKVTAAGGKIKLTPMEFGILSEMALNACKVLEDSSLLKTVWGSEYSAEKEYLRVFINHLRRKLEPDPANPKYIITVSNVGYMFSKAA